MVEKELIILDMMWIKRFMTWMHTDFMVAHVFCWHFVIFQKWNPFATHSICCDATMLISKLRFFVKSELVPRSANKKCGVSSLVAWKIWKNQWKIHHGKSWKKQNIHTYSKSGELSWNKWQLFYGFLFPLFVEWSIRNVLHSRQNACVHEIQPHWRRESLFTNPIPW